VIRVMIVRVLAVMAVLGCATTPPPPPPPNLEAAPPSDGEVESWLWRALDGVVQRTLLTHPSATWAEMQALTAIPTDDDLAHADGALWSMMVACRENSGCRLTQAQQAWVSAVLAGAMHWCDGNSDQGCVPQAQAYDQPAARLWSAYRRALENNETENAVGFAAELATWMVLPRWLQVLAPLTNNLTHWCAAATMPGTTDDIIATAARLGACPAGGPELLSLALQRHPYDPELLLMQLDRMPAGDPAADFAARSQLLQLMGDDLAVVEQLATHATSRQQWVDAVELWQRHRMLRGGEATTPVAQAELWQRMQLTDQATTGKLDRVRRRIEESARTVNTTAKRGALGTRQQLRITLNNDGKIESLVVVDPQGQRVHDGDLRLAHIVARWWRARLAPTGPEGQTLVVQVEMP
jgi:hypothetical protein